MGELDVTHRDTMSRQGYDRDGANKPGDRTCDRMGTWPPIAQVRGEDLSKEERSVPRQSWPRSGLGKAPRSGRQRELRGRKAGVAGEEVEGWGCRAQGLRERNVDFVSTKLWRASQDWRVTGTDLEL